MEEGQERTPCLRSTCITVTSSLLIPAGNFHVSVLGRHKEALGFLKMLLARSEKYSPLPSPPGLPALCFTLLYSNCASHPPHLAPPFTLIPTGKQTEGGRTHNFENELEGETLSPNPFTASDHKSQLQIELRSEIILSSSSCRDRSSGLCFPGNKKEHHNSLLASK